MAGSGEAEKWARDTGRLVDECSSLLGRELTAYLSGLDAPHYLARLLDPADPEARAARERLETARAIVRAFSDDRAPAARAWLTDVDAELSWRAPATAVRCAADRSEREELRRRAEAAADPPL
jgi:hypothetical protein